ncbi:tRNA (adenosine(37)-N6)-dimethylallyltransferase MiaA [Hippea jasoniae]|uniref:tRNA (adenosine(37)-N6)-dimethylallyltransferase MiaA n=1 Tax=Hippea jasoniae TaxID=944479 RepID=UPI000551E0E0|nr:tRNA (adenosine(37)-N6)-dimethylallyltransferase MiaA [Hippea jasoniae]
MKNIVITGPTATGKTDTTITIAKRIGGEIISADSMQIYKGLDIGTAKPDKQQLNAVRHYLIDIKNPCEIFSAGEFAKVAQKLIKIINKKGKPAIVAGGTGFYLDALINGLNNIPEVNSQVKRFFDDYCDEFDSPRLYEWLRVIDKTWASHIKETDCQRIKRGLSVFVSSRTPISEFFKQKHAENQSFFIFVLYASKDWLSKRILKRSKQMVSSGIIEETEKLLHKGFLDCDAIKAIGYKETVEYILRKIKTKDELAEKIADSTIKYAKRQLTFLKSRFKNAIWIDVEHDDPVQKILDTVSGHFP